MNTHIASPQKVARSWLLEKLLGPERPTPQRTAPTPAPARQMTDRDREQVLEGAYESIKGDVIQAIKSEIHGLDAAESRIAKRHGIDPLFLNWYVVNGSHWSPMAARTKKALKAMQSVRLWFAAIPSHWRNMQVPTMDEGRARDAALKELGEWFVKNSVTKIERKFTNAIWKQSRDLISTFRGRGARPDAKASLLLMKDFKNRLGRDRFQLKPAVRRVVELFD